MSFAQRGFYRTHNVQISRLSAQTRLSRCRRLAALHIVLPLLLSQLVTRTTPFRRGLR